MYIFPNFVLIYSSDSAMVGNMEKKSRNADFTKWKEESRTKLGEIYHGNNQTHESKTNWQCHATPPPQKKTTTNQTKVHVSKHIIKCPVRKISRIRHDIIVPKIQRMLATNFGNNSVLKLSVRPIRKWMYKKRYNT